MHLSDPRCHYQIPDVLPRGIRIDCPGAATVCAALLLWPGPLLSTPLLRPGLVCRGASTLSAICRVYWRQAGLANTFTLSSRKERSQSEKAHPVGKQMIKFKWKWGPEKYDEAGITPRDPKCSMMPCMLTEVGHRFPFGFPAADGEGKLE